MKKCLLSALAIFLLATSSLCAEPVKITGINAYSIGDYDQIEVDTSGRANSAVINLESNNSIAIVFTNAKIDNTMNITPPSQRIKTIQAVQFNPDTVYVIVRSVKELEYEYARLIGKNRVILELGREKEDAPVIPIKEAAESPAVTILTPEAVTFEVKEEKVIQPVKVPETIPKNFKIYIAGKLFSDYKKAAVKHDAIMVSSRKFFDAVNASIDFNKRTQVLHAKIKYEWDLKLKVNSREGWLRLVDYDNNKFTSQKIMMPAAPAYIRGLFKKELYVPLVPIAEVLGYDVSWSEDRSKLYLNAKVLDAKIDETGPVKRITLFTSNPAGEVKKRREEKNVYIDFIGAKLATKDNPMVLRGNNYDVKLYQLNNLVVTMKIFVKNMQYYTTSDFEDSDRYEVIFAPAVTKVGFERLSGTSGKLTIDSSDPIEFEKTEYSGPPRVVLDLKNTILKVWTTPRTDSSAFRGIRMYQNGIDPLSSRFVITLNKMDYKTYLSKDKKKLALIVTDKPLAEKTEKPLPLKGRTIVIDPGHGGKDPGTIGYHGSLEKNLTPMVALKLCDLLRKAGANVILTKEKDVYMNNRDIVQLSNRNNADLFISIHYNAYNSPRIGGSEVYYINKQSRGFASMMSRALAGGIGRKNRGIKESSYYTIHYAKMPAVIIEPLYITNPIEEKLAKDNKFQNLIAYSIYKGINSYLQSTKNI